MKKLNLTLLTVGLLLLSACNTVEVPEAPRASFDDAFFSENSAGTELAPGVFYEEKEGSVNLEFNSLELNETSLALLRIAVDERAGTEFEADWKAFLVTTEDAYTQIEQMGRSDLLSTLEASYEATLDAQRQNQELQGQQIQFPNCDARATAAPTTAEPGAKASASIDCNIINVNIEAIAKARAGTDNDEDDDTTGSFGYASAVAYGNYACSSTAEAVGRLKVGNIVLGYRKARNGECT